MYPFKIHDCIAVIITVSFLKDLWRMSIWIFLLLILFIILFTVTKILAGKLLKSWAGITLDGLVLFVICLWLNFFFKSQFGINGYEDILIKSLIPAIAIRSFKVLWDFHLFKPHKLNLENLKKSIKNHFSFWNFLFSFFLSVIFCLIILNSKYILYLLNLSPTLIYIFKCLELCLILIPLLVIYYPEDLIKSFKGSLLFNKDLKLKIFQRFLGYLSYFNLLIGSKFNGYKLHISDDVPAGLDNNLGEGDYLKDTSYQGFLKEFDIFISPRLRSPRLISKFLEEYENLVKDKSKSLGDLFNSEEKKIISSYFPKYPSKWFGTVEEYMEYRKINNFKENRDFELSLPFTTHEFVFIHKNSPTFCSGNNFQTFSNLFSKRRADHKDELFDIWVTSIVEKWESIPHLSLFEISDLLKSKGFFTSKTEECFWIELRAHLIFQGQSLKFGEGANVNPAIRNQVVQENLELQEIKNIYFPNYYKNLSLQDKILILKFLNANKYIKGLKYDYLFFLTGKDIDQYVTEYSDRHHSKDIFYKYNDALKYNEDPMAGRSYFEERIQEAIKKSKK